MKTKEPQYEVIFELLQRKGPTQLGPMIGYTWHLDPKRIAFLFSRYKFVSKMFDGFESVVEIGCADGFASRLVQQTVKRLVLVDFDPVFIQEIQKRQDPDWPLEVNVHDLVQKPLSERFDGAYAIDVFEHVDPKDETAFLGNLAASLKPTGAAIIGIPSLESQIHASEASKAGHVNCKTGDHLKTTMRRFFDHVFMFSMNDEVVHTGYYPMAQYLIALCCGPKGDRSHPPSVRLASRASSK